MVVSFSPFFQQTVPGVTLTETFEAFCDGAKISGPFWDHILARLVGLPFSKVEEEAGIVDTIVELCSLDSLRGLEANRTGYVDSRLNLRHESLFRKGEAGDWVNHMMPDMARRLDDIIAKKLGASGLTFK
ncbi:hypothetical protein E2562_037318 [Oryza meyeriana var. granulata]|uniref:Sulfotransferase n=1 Tax=Oryza meyeriana var. granulata TaxID=110450 RepID=A0A6G1CZ76_9ORYZ|nr:hypothetical protein E2562_037318 [Oryza meyeriana var. granulata]